MSKLFIASEICPHIWELEKVVLGQHLYPTLLYKR